jgi:hypothetical protein
MANTFKFGNGEWAVGKETALAYNDENSNFKPLPFTFDRASTATVVNKDGLIETVGVDEPRIDFLNNTKGHLLLEPQRRNDILYSEDIESWSISGTITKENNVAISPDGTLNAGTITTNDASGFHRITQTISVSSNSTYTSSLFIKKVQSQTNYMGIGFVFTGGTADVGYVIFDAVNGIAVSADVRIDVISEVKDFGDYWRLQSTATDNGSNTSLQFNIYATLSTNGTTTGLGISSPRTIWGIQLEAGTYATSYIPTSGQSGGVTRSAETCYNQPPSGVIGQTELTLFYQGIVEYSSSDGHAITLSQGLDGSGSERMLLYRQSDGNVYFYIIDSTTQFSTPLLVNSNPQYNDKYAIAIKQNDLVIYCNGVKAAENNSGTLPSTQYVYLNEWSNQINHQSKIMDVRLYNTALTDQELAELTT